MSEIVERWKQAAETKYIPVRGGEKNRILFRFCPETGIIEVQEKGQRYFFDLGQIAAEAMGEQRHESISQG